MFSFFVQNIMTFNKCSINGKSYGDPVDKYGNPIDITTVSVLCNSQDRMDLMTSSQQKRNVILYFFYCQNLPRFPIFIPKSIK